ncbi:nucleoside triphosphate pyrophosphohydrolase family protein [Ligilactobacillus sp.]|uniref:nucleoside triphosphate pyrophosphohydrolase family protein n=1 Tax=Ligilactobacillus sp. TaxID=2767921 RepID=UPI002FE0EAAF
MEFNEYQKAANRTLYGNEQVLTNCALGLAGESGQLIDLIQDYTFKGKDLDKEKMIDELGDVLWYLSQIAQWAGVDFDDVAKSNIETLNKRYPNGFTTGM